MLFFKASIFVAQLLPFSLTGERGIPLVKKSPASVVNFSVFPRSCTDSASRKSSVESVVSNDAVMSDPPPAEKLPPLPEEGQQQAASTASASGATRTKSISSTSSSASSGLTCNNNSLPKEVSVEELELLKKLEEQNR